MNAAADVLLAFLTPSRVRRTRRRDGGAAQFTTWILRAAGAVEADPADWGQRVAVNSLLLA